MIDYRDYLARRAHAIFRKKPKPGGRDVDRFWAILGRAFNAARDQVLAMVREARAGSSDGDWLLDHGSDRGIEKIPGEETAAYLDRASHPWAYWRYAGSPVRLVEHAALLGYAIAVYEVYRDYAPGAPRPRWARLRITVTGLGTFPQRDFLLALRRRRPARSLMDIVLGEGIRYGRFDDGGFFDDLGQFDDWEVAS